MAKLAFLTKEVVPRAARSLCAVAVGAVMTFGFAGEAKATAYASSILELSGITFTGPTFTSFNFLLQPISAELAGDTNAFASTGSKSSKLPGASLNQPLTCVDDGTQCSTFTDNGYFPSPTPAAPPGSYAVADSDLNDTTIQGAGAPGHLGSKAVANLAGFSFGNAQTGSNNSAEWNLGAHGATVVTFSGTLQIDAEAFTDTADSTAQTTAGLRVIISSTTGAPDIVLFDLSTDPATSACVALSEQNGGADHPCADLIVPIAVAIAIPAGATDEQQLRILFDTSATVTQTPVSEPATLMLMGTGLVAVGLVFRRRFGK